MNENSIKENPFKAESPANYEPKKPVLVMCDVSASMSGTSINQVNQGLAKMQKECEDNPKAAASVELAIGSFGTKTKSVRDFALIAEGNIPSLQATEDQTRIVEGTKFAIATVRQRMAWYRETNQLIAGRALMVILTDGQPNPVAQDFIGAAELIREGYEQGEFLTLFVGIPGCDLSILQKMAHPTLPPIYLDKLTLDQFFARLSQSMAAGDQRDDSNLVQILTAQ
ncbi:MAG: hypothetical protein AAF998_06805 [Bacteroidota bacterium]